MAAIRHRLHAATTSLVGARVREVLDPADAFPAVTYQEIDTVDDALVNTTDNAPFTRVQVDCWAATSPGAKAVAALVRGIVTTDVPLLPLVWGGNGGLTVDDVRIDGERSGYEPPRDASERGLFRVSIDLLIGFRL